MAHSEKKIIIAAEIFPPDIGGPATYASELFEALHSRGFEVRALCYGEPKEGEKDIARVSRKKNIFFRYAKYFFSLAKMSQGCDILYAQGPIASGIPAYFVNNLFGKKYVVKIVGDYAWETARRQGKTSLGIDEFQKSKVSGKIWFLRSLETLVCKKAKRVIVPSQYLKKIVLGWGIDEKKIDVIYNAFTPPKIQRSIQPESPHTIVSAGRLVPWKGFDALIEILPELKKEIPDCKLMILGEGPELERLEGLIKRSHGEDAVSIICVRKEQLNSFFAKSGVFILNTGYEGLSHILLEALAAGIPVITTNIGGNPEVIENEKNGILVEYNNRDALKNAVLRLFREPKLREIFYKNSKDIFAKFSKEKMIEETLKVFESV